MERKVDLGDRKVVLVGTKHVSQESVELVEEVIERESPDIVGVELDEDRLASLRNESRWKDLDMVEAVRNGQGFLLAANLFLMIYQKRLGMEEGVKPGKELLNAVEVAEKQGIPVELLDRDINKTFRRAYSKLSFWEKIKLLAGLSSTEETDIQLEEDILDELVKELENEFPTLGKIFLEERNSFMAEKLLEKDFNRAVVVVGAAHVEGLAKDLEERNQYVEEEINSLPVFKVLNYGFPVLILGLMGLGFLSGGFQQVLEMGAIWIGLNAFFSALGAVIAGAHKKTWAVTALAAPITSLAPVIGAGIVAAYVEARLHPPTVEELEEITEMTSYSELLDNQVGVVLATLIAVSILGGLATLAAASLMGLTFL